MCNAITAWTPRRPKIRELPLLAKLHLLHDALSTERNAIENATDREHTANDGTCRCKEVVPLLRLLCH